ncbi:DNA translocase FtsK [Bacillus sp. T33-2]|nr:DNA translocase FtsK [Bacillus sp. T33-2]
MPSTLVPKGRTRKAEAADNTAENTAIQMPAKPKQVKVPKKEQKYRQPFRPTEIPSPVFAFNRPKNINEIEYELTGFTYATSISSPKKQEQMLQSEADREQEPEAVVNPLSETMPGAGREQEREVVNQLLETVPEEGREQEPEAVVNPLLDTVPEAGREQEPAEALNSPFQAEPVFDPKREPKLQPDREKEPEHEVSLQQNVPSIPDLEQQPEPVQQSGLEQLADPGQPTEPVEKSEPLTPERENTKRHVPFNVLMLKQDKRKWEEKQSSISQLRNHEARETVRNRPGMEGPGKQENPPNKAADTARQDKPQLTGQTSAQAGSMTVTGNYGFPSLNLLNPPVYKEADPQWLFQQEQLLNETLKNFNVGARVVNVTQGPSVTRFEVQPEPGVKVNKITNLLDDIKLSLAARDIRIEAPIPGKHTIGIEVPNQSGRPVLLSEILQTGSFRHDKSPLSVALGLDISGTPIVTDLKKMPHGLIAGATGSGKSVCINTMLVSLLYKANPDDVKLLLIDPKMVELAPYNHIPHLVSPVITDVKAATASLKWAVEEMERRYELFAHTGVRDISRFNELAIQHKRYADKLPYIVIVIDELADLMMMAPADVEEAICRIAQKARACGIHLLIATQRPSVDVITGLIKANIPTRIAFSVSSQVDSRTIIDISGAEKLLGRGDMLFLENGSSKAVRLQGTFVTDSEIDDVVAFVRKQRKPEYLFEQDELLKKAQVNEEEDDLFYEACEFVIDHGAASTSSVQRRFKIGYNRAARLIDMMEQHGFISEGRGSKPRDVLISAADLENIQETSTLI